MNQKNACDYPIEVNLTPNQRGIVPVFECANNVKMEVQNHQTIFHPGLFIKIL